MLIEVLKNGLESAGEESTMDIGARLAKELKDGDVLAIYGDLGAGKTVFVKGLARGLGIRQTVKSPSFNVCSYYEAEPLSLAHVDAYRLASGEDFENLLIDEFMPQPKVVCVEWPQAVIEALPKNVLSIYINRSPNGGRTIVLK